MDDHLECEANARLCTVLAAPLAMLRSNQATLLDGYIMAS
jgi:hypothetical protein